MRRVLRHEFRHHVEAAPVTRDLGGKGDRIRAYRHGRTPNNRKALPHRFTPLAAGAFKLLALESLQSGDHAVERPFVRRAHGMQMDAAREVAQRPRFECSSLPQKASAS